MLISHCSILSSKRSDSTVVHNIIFIQDAKIKSQKHLERRTGGLPKPYKVSLNKKIKQA